MKLCSLCGETKAFALFPTSRGKVTGNYCRTCKSARQRETTASPEVRRGRRAQKHGDANQKARDVLSAMRQSSKSLGHAPPEFTLDEVLAVVSGGCCAVTGIAFDLSYRGQGVRNPLAPSPDRIDPKLGYTKANVQWVCWMHNLMKGDHSQDIVDRFLDAIVRKRNARNTPT